MKFTSDKITTMVSSVLRGGTSYRSHNLIHPEREWFVGIMCFLVCAIGSGWWAASLYVRFVDPSTLMTEETSTETVTFRPAQIEAALESLSVREKRYREAEAILRGERASVPVVDVWGGSVATSSEIIPEVVSNPDSRSEESIETLPPDDTTGVDVEEAAVFEGEDVNAVPTMAF